MNAFAGGPRSAPRTRLNHPYLVSKHGQDDERVQLSLRTVIGTTTRSPNGFDYDTSQNRFAYCAGPAAIITEVQLDGAIDQRIFRARINATPVNGISSFYNAATPPVTPTRRKTVSPIKDPASVQGINIHPEYLIDSPSGSKNQYRTREATCVSLGKRSNLLAVGETGYNPRILIFSAAPHAHQDIPLSSLSDHSFGVQAVAFSPDSKWLCSLGNTHDGFLLLYTISPKTASAKLYASNKCSNVHAITWMGDSIITFGTRHVKVWRIIAPASPRKGRSGIDNGTVSSSPGPRTLSGRNCLLGSLLDAVFTVGVAISDTRAILGTSNGDVCLLDDGDKTQSLEIIGRVSFPINCVHYDASGGTVLIAGDRGAIESFAVNEARAGGGLDLPREMSTGLPHKNIVAIGRIQAGYVLVDNHHVVDIWAAVPSFDPENTKALFKRLPAHESAVLGVCILDNWKGPGQVDFLTYSARGTVLFWRADGACLARIEISLEQPGSSSKLDFNELKTLCPFESQGLLFAGDKTGVLYILEASGEIVQAFRAHQGDINSIATSRGEPHNVVCTSSRDRTIQVFRQRISEACLIQTLDDHAASVTDAKFWENGALLISISSDRTIIVRKAAYVDDNSLAYVCLRVIPLKASPLSLATVSFEPNLLLVSTIDRQVLKIDLSSGRTTSSFKALDPATNESVLLSSLQACMLENNEGSLPVITGFSTTDKSIRIQGYDNGYLLAREFGQAAVATMKILHLRSEDGFRSNLLISCGFDGTVVVYNLGMISQPRNDSLSIVAGTTESPLRQEADRAQPLRKTLTKRELADFQRALEETGSHPASPLRTPSPTRIKRKTSSHKLISRTACHVPLSNGAQTHGYAPARPHSSHPQRFQDHNTQSTLKMKKKSPRPSLDYRRRSRSATNLNELSLSSKDLCDALRAFRKRVVSSVTDEEALGPHEELQSELDLTLQAVNQDRADRPSPSRGLFHKPNNQTIDAYLAKMIDERLAMNPVGNKSAISVTGTDAALDQEEVHAGACADEESSKNSGISNS